MATYRVKTFTVTVYGDGVDTNVEVNVYPDLQAANILDGQLLQAYNYSGGIYTPLPATLVNGIFKTTISSAPNSWTYNNANPAYIITLAITY